MDTDHVRLYVAMAEMFLDRTKDIAPFSGSISDNCPFRVISGHKGHKPFRYTANCSKHMVATQHPKGEAIGRWIGLVAKAAIGNLTRPAAMPIRDFC